MEAQKKFEDVRINIRVKFASLWTSFMFLYIYVDHFTLYMPNTIANITKGKVFTFYITQGFIFIVLFLATIPILMIFLSLILPVKINRLTNIIVAIILIPYMLFNLTGEVWMHMILAAVIEIVLLCLVIFYAWKWPRIETIKN